MNERDEDSSSVEKKQKKRSLGRQCGAFGCCNTFYNVDGTPSGLHFFRFPQKNPEKLRWCSMIKRVDGMDGFNVTTSTFLCDKHFTEEDIKRNPSHWRLKSGVVPSLNLHVSSVPTVQKKARKAPSRRSLATTSTNATATDEALLPLPLPPSFEFPLIFEESLPVDSSISISTQTDFSFVNSPSYLPSSGIGISDDFTEENFITYNTLQLQTNNLNSIIDSLNYQIKELNAHIAQLKKTLFSIDKLQKSDALTKFYTGFPNFSSLMATFKYFEPKLDRLRYWRGQISSAESTLSYQETKSSKPGPKRSLSHLEEFAMVLMRLKVGLFVTDLADRFGISPGHFSKVFTTWICFLFHELPDLFPFPSQELVRKNMPAQFIDYPTTRIIIDGTEIFTEIPSSMKSQSQTWSEYKHHNTWKALVGISPTGCVTFVSKLWSGKVSDKEITLKSGILSLLEDGDNVMADRGFDIQGILPAGVTLNIPPFKGRRDQLTPTETEETARIASVRIHVERAIGRIKNYHILDGVLPLTLYPISNQIFTVCCYLTNFLPLLVASPNESNKK